MSEHEGKTGVADARRLDTNFTNTHEWNEAYELVQIRGIRVNRPLHLIAFIGFEFMILSRHDSVHSARQSDTELRAK